MRLNNLSVLKERRKELRSSLTEAEKVLWKVLKSSKLAGRKFRRQHSIGYYIADFYCPSEKLVIELDGQQHYFEEGKLKDKERDEHLKLLGIKVLRFKNEEVISNLNDVLKRIEEEYTTPAQLARI
jgi:very-short-patch-repair endonuclease